MRGRALVVGAGVVGVCCALALQRRGFTVTLIDRAEPGAACSFGNSGSFGVGLVGPQATPGVVRRIPRLWLDPDEPLALRLRHLPRITAWGRRFVAAAARVDDIAAARHHLLSRALAAWDELIVLAGAEDLVRSVGMLFAFARPDGPERAGPLVELGRRHGVRIERLSGDAARRLNPALGPIVNAGLLFPDNRHTLSPIALTRRLLDRFVGLGGAVLRAEVIDIAAAVTAETGVRVVAGDRTLGGDLAVLATGAWAPVLAHRLGVALPIIAERGYHLMMPLPAADFPLPTTLSDRNIVLTPMTEGLRITGISELGGPDDPPRWRLARRLLPQARAYVPALADQALGAWSGPRPSTPDSLPVLGTIAGRPGIVLATGHGQSGLALAAITARLVGALACGEPAEIDMTPYGAARFGRDGGTSGWADRGGWR